MSDVLMKVFSRRLHSCLQPQFDLSGRLLEAVLRLEQADLDRLPKPHRCSA